MKKRPSLKEINAQIDKINKQKPLKKQIEELGDVIRKINEENTFPAKKIAAPDERSVVE